MFISGSSVDIICNLLLCSVNVPEDLEFYDPRDITAEFGALTTALALPTDFGTIQTEIREWVDYVSSCDVARYGE